MVFHWNFDDSKYPQVFRTLLSMLVDLYKTVIWMLSTCSLIFNPLGIVPSAPTTIGITVTFMFHSFFSSLVRFKNLSLFLISFIFSLWYAHTVKSTIQQVLLFGWISQSLVIWPRLGDPFVFQNPWEHCPSHSSGRIADWAYTTCFYGPIQFLVHLWITFLIQWCQVLYSFFC